MSNICYGCFKPLEEGKSKCPRCGFDAAAKQSMPFLPLGAELQQGRYVVGKRLLSNNESTKYIAFDNSLNTVVNIREFLPNGLCARKKGSNKIVLNSEKVSSYKKLLVCYLEYNRTLARLKDCSAVVKVLDIFVENNTAYVVEQRESLVSLADYIKKSGGRVGWETASTLFMPLLNTLEKMHKNGISHYGVGPGNLKINSDGKLKLQNFSLPDMRKNGTDLKPMLISGCSAPEQYDEYSTLDQSTEIYGFTAALFYALTGSVPEDVEKRRKDNRLLISTAVNKNLPSYVRQALADGLQFDREKRLSKFSDLKAELSAAPTAKTIKEEMSQPDLDDDDDDIPVKKKRKKRSGTRIYGVISCIISLVIFVIIGTLWLQENPFAKMFEPEDASSDSDVEITGETVTVPNLVGVKYEIAVEEADKTPDYQLLKAVEEEYSDDVPEGYIASQFPEAYSEETQGYSLYITVSKGAKQRELPKIEGKTVDQVAQLLGDESFVTTQIFEYSETVKKGLVIGYDAHVPGDKLEYGSSLVIKVSKGAEPKAEDLERRTSDSDKDTAAESEQNQTEEQ